MPIQSPLTENNAAYTGADLHAIVNGKELGTLQGLSVSIAREVVAVYVMGSEEPKAFARGKRAINGAFSFAQLDRDALLFDAFDGIYGDQFNSLSLDNTSNLLVSRYNPATQSYETNRQLSSFGQNISLPSNVNNSSSLVNFDSEGLNSLYKLAGQRKLRYPDQLPEFDLTVMLINSSQGRASYFTLSGVIIMNQGFSITIEDLTTEVAYTYAARSYTPLIPLGTNLGVTTPSIST